MWRSHAVRAPPQPTDLSALASPPLRRGRVGNPGSSYTRTAAPSHASPVLVLHNMAVPNAIWKRMTLQNTIIAVSCTLHGC